MTDDPTADASPAPLSRVVLDGDVSEERLRYLLSLGCESPDLDYKGTCDPSLNPHRVELAKDIGAMMLMGGYLVIGVDGQGGPVGLSQDAARRFDEARLVPVLEKYLPAPVVVSSQVWDIQGVPVAIVYVPRARHGGFMFKSLGQYRKPGGKKLVLVFRVGDIFYRNGTRSERLDPIGFEKLLARTREEVRQEERHEAQEQLAATIAELRAGSQGQQVAQAPSPAVTLSLDPDALTAAAIELSRSKDHIPLLRALRTARKRVQAVLGDVAWESEVATVADNLACLGATSLLIEDMSIFDESLQSMVSLYGLGFTEPLRRRGSDAEKLWLLLARRAMAEGALAVRLGKWSTVRDIVLAPVEGVDVYYTSWLRHALTMASRAGHMREQIDQGTRELSLILLARADAERLEPLHPDAMPGDEILNSLIQFDFLANLISISTDPQHGANYYPNFAHFFTERTEPIVVRLLKDSPMRFALFPGSDEELAQALLAINSQAGRIGVRFTGWFGFTNEVIRAFLTSHGATTAT